MKTNSQGIYRFDGVNVGDYVVSATAQGFVKAEIPATVTVGSTVGRDLKLAAGSSETVVEVTSDSLQLQTEDAVRGGTIETKQLIDLPILNQNSLRPDPDNSRCRALELERFAGQRHRRGEWCACPFEQLPAGRYP